MIPCIVILPTPKIQSRCACFAVSRPVSLIHRLTPFGRNPKQLINRPWNVRISGRDVGVLESVAPNEVIDAFRIVVIHILLGIVQIDPVANLHNQLFWVLLGVLKVGMVPSFTVFEARSLCACNTLKSVGLSLV